ncbi:MAG: hypothetical protein C4582_00795 [Desulfobacteraceae bacterium]|nr:MAG: hypothetical protein C4582_00795 [Desulfobacteraceae bacterium]
MEYKGPRTFLVVFYLCLGAWTVVSAALLGPRASSGAWPLGQLLMIGFVVAYTWYFSLGISYRMRIGEDGIIEMQSFRRVIRVSAGEIAQVEGPRLALLPYGFLRVRLEREKAYIFCKFGSEELVKALSRLKHANKDVKIKFLPS